MIIRQLIEIKLFLSTSKFQALTNLNLEYIPTP